MDHDCVQNSLTLVPVLSQQNSVNTIPFYILKIYFNIVLHLFLGLESVLVSPGFTIKTLCMLLFSPIGATCPAHFILLDLITLLIYIWGGVKSWSSSVSNFLHSYVTSSLLDTHIFFSTLYSNTLSLHSEWVSHPKTTTKLGDKIFWTELKLAVTRLNVLFISSWMTFWFHCILYYLNFVTFWKNLLAMATCDFVLHDTWI